MQMSAQIAYCGVADALGFEFRTSACPYRRKLFLTDLIFDGARPKKSVPMWRELLGRALPRVDIEPLEGLSFYFRSYLSVLSSRALGLRRTPGATGPACARLHKLRRCRPHQRCVAKKSSFKSRS
jgi:hypothetical protein